MVLLHSEANVFRFDENTAFVRHELEPAVVALRERVLNTTRGRPLKVIRFGFGECFSRDEVYEALSLVVVCTMESVARGKSTARVDSLELSCITLESGGHSMMV